MSLMKDMESAQGMFGPVLTGPKAASTMGTRLSVKDMRISSCPSLGNRAKHEGISCETTF